MTIDIKFRVWDKKKKHFIIPWTGNGYDDIDITYTGENWYITGGHKLSPRRYVMLQYTGLKDKNRKEIYEGDIVHRHIAYFPKNTDYICPIERNMDGTWVLGGELNCGTYMLGTEVVMGNVKVIGNIYENDLDIISMAKEHSKTMEGLAEK